MVRTPPLFNNTFPFRTFILCDNMCVVFLFLISSCLAIQQHHLKTKYIPISAADFSDVFAESFISRSKLFCTMECLKIESETTLFDPEKRSCSCHDYMELDVANEGEGVFIIQGERKIPENSLVIQRRCHDNKETFQRDWSSYKSGFGSGDAYWKGLQAIHELTKTGLYGLNVSLEYHDGIKGYSKYNIFRIGDEASNYQLIIGGYSGTAGDSLARANRSSFLTYDKDYSNWASTTYRGGWWHVGDDYANLNGVMEDMTTANHGVYWYSYSIKRCEMLKRTEMRLIKN